MKYKRIDFKYKGEKVGLALKECRGIGKIVGLMFSRRKMAEALIFEFKKDVNMAIHSWFVFFPFWAIWFDKNNKIIEIKKIKPFQFHIKPKKSYRKLIEIPINGIYDKIVEVIVNTRKI